MPAISITALYAAERSDLIAYGILGIFLTVGIFLIFYSLYRHLAANRLL